jgi:hypothetical protein
MGRRVLATCGNVESKVGKKRHTRGEDEFGRQAVPYHANRPFDVIGQRKQPICPARPVWHDATHRLSHFHCCKKLSCFRHSKSQRPKRCSNWSYPPKNRDQVSLPAPEARIAIRTEEMIECLIQLFQSRPKEQGRIRASPCCRSPVHRCRASLANSPTTSA